VIITKIALPRRTFLRGIGTTLALPLLDAMIPALSPIVKTAAAPVRRLGFVYIPQGANMPQWKVKGEGADFEWSPILQPLAPFRKHVHVLSGLAHKQAESLGDGEGDHARATTAWLTGIHGKRTEGDAVRAGVSMDQIAAAELGQYTPLPSLELALEKIEFAVGTCDAGYACVYQNTFSWKTETTPVPMEVHPRAAFERLFGDEATPKEQLAQRRFQRSVLDSVIDEMRALQQRLGAGDRRTTDEYLDSIRDVEKRIQRAEQFSPETLEGMPMRPTDIPLLYEDHAKLMFDLAVLAYRADITRVVSYLMARESSVRTYPEIGVPDPHHPISHHRDNPDNLAKLTKINLHHMGLFAYFVDKLQNTPDGDGNLLEHVMLVYGSGISDPNVHLHYDLPCVLVGGGAGRLSGGRHLVYPRGTPMTNLCLTLLDKMDIPGVDKLGDSDGRLTLAPLAGV
jgi:hypothetical protein